MELRKLSNSLHPGWTWKSVMLYNFPRYSESKYSVSADKSLDIVVGLILQPMLEKYVMICD